MPSDHPLVVHLLRCSIIASLGGNLGESGIPQIVKYITSALTNCPVSRLLIFIWIWKGCPATKLSEKLGGLINLLEGILVFAGILPIGAGLQDPSSICLPSVISTGCVKQKLMLRIRPWMCRQGRRAGNEVYAKVNVNMVDTVIRGLG